MILDIKKTGLSIALIIVLLNLTGCGSPESNDKAKSTADISQEKSGGTVIDADEKDSNSNIKIEAIDPN